jgi:hypothetical protein
MISVITVLFTNFKLLYDKDGSQVLTVIFGGAPSSHLAAQRRCGERWPGPKTHHGVRIKDHRMLAFILSFQLVLTNSSTGY